MENLFNVTDRDALLARIVALNPGAGRQWGKMTAPQMLAHCTVGFQFPLGEKAGPQMFLGRLLARFVKKGALGPKPLPKNGPTGPDFIIRDERDFEHERQRLYEYVMRFCAEGRGGVNNRVHGFFGPLTGDEWGRLMYKHVDHHLRQFGA